MSQYYQAADELEPVTPVVGSMDLFRNKYDLDAPLRRLQLLDDAAVADELQRRDDALELIRTGRLDDSRMLDSLYTAHLMLLEDDGKNAVQLRQAGLGDFLDSFLFHQLQSLEAGNRPAIDELCSVVVALLWQWCRLDYGGCFGAEGDLERRANIMKFLDPFLFSHFYYDIPSSRRPHSPPLLERARTIDASQGLERGSQRRRVRHFGRDLDIQIPPIALYAVSLYIACVESQDLMYSQEEDCSIVRDIVDYHNACHAHVAHFRSQTPLSRRSLSYEADWARIACSSTPSTQPRAFRLGDLSGSWVGTSVLCTFEHLDENPSNTRGLGTMTSRRPTFLQLEEHYHYKTLTSNSRPDSLDDVRNIPKFRFPPLFSGLSKREVRAARSHTSDPWQLMTPQGGWDMHIPGSNAKVFYKTFDARPQESSDELIHAPEDSQDGGGIKYSDVTSVILTGKQTPTHAASTWGAFDWRGRVGMSDGLVELVRRSKAGPSEESKARVLLVGYVLSSCVFVGRWSRGWIEDGNGPDALRWPSTNVEPHWGGICALWKTSS